MYISTSAYWNSLGNGKIHDQKSLMMPGYLSLKNESENNRPFRVVWPLMISQTIGALMTTHEGHVASYGSSSIW